MPLLGSTLSISSWAWARANQKKMQWNDTDDDNNTDNNTSSFLFSRFQTIYLYFPKPKYFSFNDFQMYYSKYVSNLNENGSHLRPIYITC